VTTPGQVVSFLLAFSVSAIWWRLRPMGPMGGAGGAIFPVLIVITILYFATAWLGPVLDEQVFDRKNARRLRGERVGRPFLKDLERARKRREKSLGDGGRQVLDGALARLESALDGDDADEMEAALRHSEVVAQEQLGIRRKGIFRDFGDSIGSALLIALLLRLFVVEAFKIPSGSMVPTLAIGDHIFVNKFIYGLTIPFSSPPSKIFRFADPKPGDVIVFIAPEPADNAGEDFIKRVVAVAGQRIQLRDGVVHIDGKPYTRTGGDEISYRETSDFSPMCMERRAQEFTEDVNGATHSVLYERHGLHDWPTYNPNLNGLDCDDNGCTVKEGYVFCMGDNRDNSADSRKWGAVPLENVKGRAMFVWLSVDTCESAKRFMRLPEVRWERVGHGIH